jgi:RNA polymerase primary sigma factor
MAGTTVQLLMNRRPTYLKSIRSASALTWELLQAGLATEHRYQVLKPHLVPFLAKSKIPILTELNDPSFAERREPSRVQTPGDPLSVYWSDLQRLRPTTRQEEFVIARTIDLMRSVILAVLGKQPPKAARAYAEEFLSPYSPALEKLRLLPLTKAADRDMPPSKMELLQQRIRELSMTQSSLVHRNLHAVPATARRYRHVGVPWEDLIQEGNTALLRAVERYKREEGVRFANYAGWWIQQGILKALSFQSRTVRLPVYLAQALRRVRETQFEEPEALSADTISERTGLPLSRVERALKADRQCLSLNRTATTEEEGCLANILPDPRKPSLPDQPSCKDLRVALEQQLSTIPAREALVLRLRFGLEDGRYWTLEEVRQRLGISRERVRQLQAQSLSRLTRPTPKKELARFL